MSCQISLRVTERDKILLRKVSSLRGEDVSDLVRRAIRTELARLNYLTTEESKALGISAHASERSTSR
jgi:uncharacterized protein (DUF1778 family)